MYAPPAACNSWQRAPAPTPTGGTEHARVERRDGTPARRHGRARMRSMPAHQCCQDQKDGSEAVGSRRLFSAADTRSVKPKRPNSPATSSCPPRPLLVRQMHLLAPTADPPRTKKATSFSQIARQRRLPAAPPIARPTSRHSSTTPSVLATRSQQPPTPAPDPHPVQSPHLQPPHLQSPHLQSPQYPHTTPTPPPRSGW